MTDFKIRRGLSKTLFVSPGIPNPKLIIEEGCWYLCTDTAELFLGIDDHTLKQINEVKTDSTDKEIITTLEELENKVQTLINLEQFKKIADETELPTNFNAEDFNPNIVYYILTLDGKAKTYIFDKSSSSYVQTNNVDIDNINSVVTEAVDAAFEDILETKIPQAIINTFQNAILFGGNAEVNNT